jgi:opacity protein-like surface antigen
VAINSSYLRVSALRQTVVVVVVVVVVAAAASASAADVDIASATSHWSFQLAVVVAGDGIEPVE